MRVVLYADDMEPITVIDLSGFAADYLKAHGHVRLAVSLPCTTANPGDPVPPALAKNCPTVSITAERFFRNNHECLMLFTKDEVSALLLKSAFLPGQQGTIRSRDKEIFAAGFLAAMKKLGKK